MREICAAVGLVYSPIVLSLPGAPEHRDRGGNSSFGDLEPGKISTRAIGRFREALPTVDIAFIQLVAGPQMAALGYDRVGIELRGTARLRFWLAQLPVDLARMVGWMVLASARRRRGVRVPQAKQGTATP
jgi:hypothetical protein